jgi:hypothetical protein
VTKPTIGFAVFSLVVLSTLVSGCSSQEAALQPQEPTGLTAKVACEEAVDRLESFMAYVEIALLDPEDTKTLVSMGDSIVKEGTDIIALDIEDPEQKTQFEVLGKSWIKLGEHLKTKPEPYTNDWAKGSKMMNKATSNYKALSTICIPALKD